MQTTTVPSGMFPNHPHIGPRNQILQQGTNPLDEIARTHDIAYGLARTYQDIKEADEEFLKQVNEHTPDSIYDWLIKHIAYTGIGIKYNTQKITGLIYPILPKNHQDNIKNYALHTTTIQLIQKIKILKLIKKCQRYATDLQEK